MSMTFKTNLLPPVNNITNSTIYTLGDSDQQWKIFGDLTGTSQYSNYLATFKSSNLSGGTYGSQYPLYGYWRTNNILKLAVTNYYTETDYANKLTNTDGTISVGSVTNPVYFASGVPVACTMAGSENNYSNALPWINSSGNMNISKIITFHDANIAAQIAYNSTTKSIDFIFA